MEKKIGSDVAAVIEHLRAVEFLTDQEGGCDKRKAARLTRIRRDAEEHQHREYDQDDIDLGFV